MDSLLLCRLFGVTITRRATRDAVFADVSGLPHLLVLASRWGTVTEILTCAPGRKGELASTC